MHSTGDYLERREYGTCLLTNCREHGLTLNGGRQQCQLAPLPTWLGLLLVVPMERLHSLQQITYSKQGGLDG